MTARRYRFCRSDEGDVVSYQAEGMRIRRGRVQSVTVAEHVACRQAFEERERQTAARENDDLRTTLAVWNVLSFMATGWTGR